MSLTRLPPPPFDDGWALFLDFDGTLAPIQDNPDTVEISDARCEALVRIAQELSGALAIISGRGVDDLSARVPAELWRIGAHGLNVLAPGADAASARQESAPAPLAREADAIAASMEGVRVETKGPILAVHYRAAPEMGDALLIALSELISRFPGYKLQAGKMVIEAKPVRANKGHAVRERMEQAPFAGRLPVMVGDDSTDEDAFVVVRDLGGFAVKVGRGESDADYRLNAPDDVWSWLGVMGAV